MCRIGVLPEGREPDAAHGVDEAFLLGAQRSIDVHDALDRGGDLTLRYRRSDDFTERGEAVGRAAETDLVPLLAMLVDAQHADMPDVVMPAGIHASRHLELD